jgi:hypothetical protein
MAGHPGRYSPSRQRMRRAQFSRFPSSAPRARPTLGFRGRGAEGRPKPFSDNIRLGVASVRWVVLFLPPASLIAMGGSATPTLDLTSLGRGGSSTFLYGESRAVVNRLLFGMVRAIDPEPLWLDLGPRRPPGEEPGPAELGWIAKDRLFLAEDPEMARPQDAVANMALSNVVRADEPATLVARVADFVRLAPIAQDIISRVRIDGPRHALAISNSDQVRGDYPHTIEGIQPIVTALVEAPLVPFIGAQGTPGAGRMAFSFVFEVRAKDLAHWRDGSLRPEKVPGGSGVQVGVPIPLPHISGLADVFAAAPSRK